VTSRRSLTPSAARLTMSLRDIGYDFPAAVADLVDNSISAGARRVDIVVEFDGSASRVFIADDGSGMTTYGVHEALRFGSRRGYARSRWCPGGTARLSASRRGRSTST
jgi:signal transduction histidine kinase